MAVVSRFKKGATGKKQWRAVISDYDIYGKRHQRTSKWFDSKEDAKEAERSLIAKYRSSADFGARFGETCMEWIEATKKDNTSQTYAEKCAILNTYLDPIQNMRLRDITPSTLKKFFSEPIFDHLGTSRKNRIRGMISSTFKYAMAMYCFPSNPVEAIPTWKKTTQERLKTKVVYDVDQFKQMLAKVSDNHWEYKNIYTMLYLTGMRLNECLSLTFNDVVGGGSQIHIWRQWKRKEGWTLLKSEGSERTIALNRDCQRLIQEELAYYEGLPGFSMDWFIFGGPKKISGNTTRTIANEAQQAANLPHCRLHDLRHAHASILLEHMHGDGDILKVSKRLGHSSVTTTLDIYAHVINKSEKETIEVLDSLF